MKTSISGFIAALLGFITILATVPTELQKMLMDCFPHAAQPYIAIIFAAAAFIARTYQARHTQDSKPAVKDSLTAQPEPIEPPDYPHEN
tara:strand:+ start:231 stop:497 length:267 start_codon:yes stop_codon:yes gene_type:complete